MPGLTKWLILAAFALLFQNAKAQTLSLSVVNDLARKNYPVIKRKDLIRQTANLNIGNISKGYLPQLSLNGQASYQSEVTRLDIPLPGFKIDAPEKDQYRFTADINQLVSDGGATRELINLQRLNTLVEEQQVEVELHELKDRINNLYLGILYVGEQLKQVELNASDIKRGLNSVEAQYENGVAFRSNVNILEAELIKVSQRLTELKATRKSLLETLSLFINQPIDSNVVLQRPSVALNRTGTISRPELKLFENQERRLAHQHKLIRAKNLPRTSIFFQGGYGRPGLNLLKNEPDLFYIGGVRVNWSLAGLYTKKNDRQIIRVNQNLVDVQRDVFMLNTNAELKTQHSEIEKLHQLIDSDLEIILLRKSITESAKSQLQNGVITANDYLREVNAEDQARQNLLSHEIQLLQAQIKFQTLSGT